MKTPLTRPGVNKADLDSGYRHMTVREACHKDTDCSMLKEGMEKLSTSRDKRIWGKVFKASSSYFC